MRVVIGSDHRGFLIKSRIVDFLKQQGIDVADEGTHSNESCDYPDVASQVAKRVACDRADRGILICGTGIGMQITANKFNGVRACVCHDEVEAEICRRHNDTNVLCLSSSMVSERRIENLVKTWLTTEFEGGRHARRVEKISQIERQDRNNLDCD